MINRSWRLIVHVINEHLTEANTMYMYKPPKNRLNYCNRMSSYSTAATCIFYHSNREHTLDRNKPQLAVFSFLNICGVTWWYIKYIQFVNVRGHAYSKRGRVYGKGGVNWVWTPPPLQNKLKLLNQHFNIRLLKKALNPLPPQPPNLE